MGRLKYIPSDVPLTHLPCCGGGTEYNKYHLDGDRACLTHHSVVYHMFLFSLINQILWFIEFCFHKYTKLVSLQFRVHTSF